MLDTYTILRGNKFLYSIRNGMVMAIPAVMVGVFAILLVSLPVGPYQDFIHTFAQGFLVTLFTVAQNCTVDIFVLILLVTISHTYGRLLDVRYPGILTVLCICAYTAFAMDYQAGFSINIYDKTRLFEAFFIVFIVSRLYLWMTSGRFFRVISFSEGADSHFNAAMSSMLPFASIIIITILFRLLLSGLTGSPDLQSFLTRILTGLFAGGKRNIWSLLEFVFLVHSFWFFGIHGSNLLESVARDLFVPGVAVNAALIESGLPPTEIVSKAFLDAFVLMGGSGTTLCLVLALILFEKRRNVRNLALTSSSQVLFNINELMIFGLPIVFNINLVIPFILVPLAVTCTSYLAVLSGLVPMTVHQVSWTTPVLLSGYVATGSPAGAILQLVNILLGIAIYAPFVFLQQRRYRESVKRSIDCLAEIVKKAEADGESPDLDSLTGEIGSVCRMLKAELKSDIRSGKIDIHYQPQVHYNGAVIGMEALLRWKYDDYGSLYPPLVGALAEDAELSGSLAQFITDKACADMERMKGELESGICVSVNYNPKQISDPLLIEGIRTIVSRYDLGTMKLGIEITEQSILSCSELINRQIMALKEMGVAVIMDDFGMGHSSMSYLQHHHFDEVKLDGSLVKELMINQRCREIISSIVYLSQSLHFSIMAEFVETKEQLELLHELGCDQYQGWYYSPAVPFEQAVEYIRGRGSS